MNRFLRPTLSNPPLRNIALVILFSSFYFLSYAQTPSIQIENCPEQLINLQPNDINGCDAFYSLADHIVTNYDTDSDDLTNTTSVSYYMTGANPFGSPTNLQDTSNLHNDRFFAYGLTQIYIIAEGTDGVNTTFDTCTYILLITEEPQIPADFYDDVTVDMTGDCYAELVLPDPIILNHTQCPFDPNEEHVVAFSWSSMTVEQTLPIIDAHARTTPQTIYVIKFVNNNFLRQGTVEMNITVEDSTIPAISCPDDETVQVAVGCEYIYNYEISAVVPCTSTLTQNAGIPSGSALVVGDNYFEYEIVPEGQGEAEPVICSWTITLEESAELGTQLNCIGHLNVSIDETCSATLDASDMLLGNTCDINALVLTAVMPNGEVLSGSSITFNDTHVGSTVDVSVGDANGVNMCWGSVTIEDKSAPIIICPEDEVISCTDSRDTSVLGVAIVRGQCEDVTVNYRDAISTESCGEFQEVISRTFYAIDGSGNMSVPCVQTIYVERETLDGAIYPPHWDGIEVHSGINDNGVGSNPPLACDGEGKVWNPLTNEEGRVVPSPYPKIDKNGDTLLIGTGYPAGIGACGNIMSWYNDLVIDICNDDGCSNYNPSFKVVRTWEVMDWCTGMFAEHVQIIKVLDTVPPVFDGNLEDFTVSTDLWGCGATIDLPSVLAKDQCSTDIKYSWSTSGGTYDAVNGRIYIPSIALTELGDPIQLIATAEDCCGNLAYDTAYVTIVDNVEPIVVADEHTVVSLNNKVDDAVTKVWAETFDDGSFDGCGKIDFWVRRIDTACPSFDGNPKGELDETKVFQKYVHFCCSDIGVERMVEFMVCDDADRDGIPEMNGDDNCNSAMIIVTTQDKIAPSIVCPPKQEINCIEFEIFEELLDKELSQKEIELLNATFGTAYTSSACGDISVQTLSGGENCGVGEYRRTFTVENSNGKASCTQIINVVADEENVLTCERISFPKDSKEYEIYTAYIKKEYSKNETPPYPDQVWCLMNPYYSGGSVYEGVDLPAITIDKCGDATITRPVIDIDNLCTEVGMNLTLDTFNFAGGGCMKILAHWEIIDQCIFVDNYYNENGEIDPFVPENGYFEMYVEYDIFDQNPPEIQCINASLFAWDCEKNYDTYSITVEDDCTPQEYISITYKVDIDADGDFDYPKDGSFAEGNVFDANLVKGLAIGNHEIKWIAYDGCGNYSTCTQKITITKPFKAPTPYCHLGISSAVMDSIYGCSMETWATDFVAGGSDDCGDEITYTMIPYMDIYGDPANEEDDLSVNEAFEQSQPNWVFDCSYIENGEAHVIEIRIYAVDEDGVYDFCDASLTLNDNFDCCEDLFPSQALIGGQISTEEGAEISDVEVNIMTNNPEFPRYKRTSADGTFMFNNLMMDRSYEVSAFDNNNTRKGISTLDLVMIQRHILGITQLDSPYKIIAADINNNSSITAADLFQLRKLILGLYPNNELPSNTSWRFVDKEFKFVDPLSPFPFDESITVANLHQAMYNQDFIAVKVGDVNSSVAGLGNGQAQVRNQKTLEIVASDESFTEGDLTKVSFTADQLVTMSGIQFELALDGLEFKSIESGMLEVDESNFAVVNNKVNFSWNNALTNQLNKDDVLFTMVFAAKQSGSISQNISLTNTELKAEAYNEQLEVLDLNLTFRTNTINGFELYQNEPNPFNNATAITFNLPEAGQASLKVFDVTGRTLLSLSEQFNEGKNTVTINKSKIGISGILYYQLTYGNNSATRKMILLD